MIKQTGGGNGATALGIGWIIVILVALTAAVGQSFGRFSFGILLPAIRDDLGISLSLIHI